MEVEQPGPGVEDLLDLVAVPGLLAGHQADVEVVAVDPQVELVEGAHGRPAVLVAEGDRDEAVLLHLRAEGLELVERLGLLVAVLLEDALAVEDRPRVVGRRDEVLLAVVAGRGLLERVGHPGARQVLPDVGDVAREALGGEEPHPVAGEPHPHVVGRALEVVVDVLLEGVVVDRVDLGRQAGVGLLEGVHDGLDGGLRHGVGLVGADRHGAGGGTAGAGAAAAATTGGEQGGRGEERPGAERAAQQGPTAHAADGGRDEAGEVLGLGGGAGHDGLL